LAAAICAAVLLLLAPGASAQTQGSERPASASSRTVSVVDPNGLTAPRTLTRPPKGHVLSARDATAIAALNPKIRAERERQGRGVTSRAFMKGSDRWQVSYYKDGKEIAQVLIDDRSGSVLEAWTGFQVAWSMARGYPGAFGRKVNAWYVWIPLCVLFVAPFVDPRRPFRLLHLDLLVLVGLLSASLAFFNHGKIGVSVPLAAPPLLYLLIRMLLAGFRPRPPRAPPRTLVPWRWLLVATIFLIGFRVTLNVTDGNVIDVGYSGVVGANHLVHGKPLYGDFPKDNQHGDTYGPVNYYAYVPFERAWPWSGHWDDLPAAHGAAIGFDLLTIGGLFLLGWRRRGPPLGAALAYAWATCPWTLLVSSSGANDTLVALLVVLALLLAARPAARGAAIALAGLTKFGPLALAPLFATYREGRRSLHPLRLLAYLAGFAVTAAVAMLPVLIHGDLHTFYDRTLAYQGERGSPFSIWGFEGDLGFEQAVWKIGAIALAVLVAFVPRRRDLRTLAALSAAVLLAAQLGITHWFYLYVVWFLPPLFLVLFDPPAPAPPPAPVTPPAQRAEAARSRQPVAAGSLG
jgi:hypothetical protein